MADYIDIVFDGPPGPVSGRFVEVQLPDGASAKIGVWRDEGEGLWSLRISADEIARAGGNELSFTDVHIETNERARG